MNLIPIAAKPTAKIVWLGRIQQLNILRNQKKGIAGKWQPFIHHKKRNTTGKSK